MSELENAPLMAFARTSRQDDQNGDRAIYLRFNDTPHGALGYKTIERIVNVQGGALSHAKRVDMEGDGKGDNKEWVIRIRPDHGEDMAVTIAKPAMDKYIIFTEDGRMLANYITIKIPFGSKKQDWDIEHVMR